MSDALAAIDFELARAEAEKSRPGWTDWALGAALGTLLWLYVTEMADPAFSFDRSTHVAFIAGLVANSIAVQFHPPVPKMFWPRPEFRVTTWDQAIRGHLPLAIVPLMAQTAFLVAAIYWWRDGGWLLTSIFAVASIVLVGCIALIAPFMRVMTHLPISLPLKHAKNSRLAYLLVPAFWLALAATHFLAVDPFARDATGLVIGIANLRSGLLVPAMFFLLYFAIAHRTDRTGTDTIVEVRRDLVFGRVAPETAMRRLEMVSAGMRVADYLQRLTDPMIALLSVISRESNRRLTVLQAAVATVGTGDRPLAESERVILVTALQSSAPHPELPGLIQRFEGSMKQLEQQGMTITNQGGSPVEVAQAVRVFAPMIMEERRKAARIDECTAILQQRLQAGPAT